MVSDCDLVLVFGFVKVFVKHLNKGLLGIEFSLIVLRVDVDFVFEFFSFGDTHDFTPVSKQFLFVEVDDFVFALDFRSKNVFFHFGQFF